MVKPTAPTQQPFLDTAVAAHRSLELARQVVRDQRLLRDVAILEGIETAGLSKSQLAEALGVSVAGISKMAANGHFLRNEDIVNRTRSSNEGAPEISEDDWNRMIELRAEAQAIAEAD